MRLRSSPLVGARTVAVLAALLLLPAGSAAAATPAKVIGALNALRAANGIPSGLKEKKKWSRACALHNEYERRNRVTGHGEDPSKPGYTKEGAWAGLNGELASVLPEFSRMPINPYLWAPFHLAALLNPWATKAGVDQTDSLDCEIASGHRSHRKRDTFWTYPGPGASTDWLQRPFETTGTPGDYVGIPNDSFTGPTIYVVWDGPRGTGAPKPLAIATKASVTGPDGKRVPVKIVDVRKAPSQVFPGQAFLVLPKALKPDSTYSARVVFSSGDDHPRKRSHSWQFRTGGVRTGSGAVSIDSTRLANGKTRIRTFALDPNYYGLSAPASFDYGFDGDPGGAQHWADPSWTVEQSAIDVQLGPDAVLTVHIQVPSMPAGNSGATIGGFTVTKAVHG